MNILGRGGRVAEGARLEIWYSRKAIVGSNPTLSAIVRHRGIKKSPPFTRRGFLFHFLQQPGQSLKQVTSFNKPATPTRL